MRYVFRSEVLLKLSLMAALAISKRRLVTTGHAETLSSSPCSLISPNEVTAGLQAASTPRAELRTAEVILARRALMPETCLNDSLHHRAFALGAELQSFMLVVMWRTCGAPPTMRLLFLFRLLSQRLHSRSAVGGTFLREVPTHYLQHQVRPDDLAMREEMSG